jgi:SAM-dependent methyltransferase
MGHVFDYNESRQYERWREEETARSGFEREIALFRRMVVPGRGETLLDVGCGTGRRLLAYRDLGLQVTGVDPSPSMLEIAERIAGKRAELHRAEAEDLPFDDNAFAYASVIHTLEFVEDPLAALEEIFRVTKDRVFIGILNRQSFRGLRVGLTRRFTRNVWRHARLFSVWELRRMIRKLGPNFGVDWCGFCHFRVPMARRLRLPDPVRFPCRNPVHPFLGLSVELTPRFRTRPLLLECPADPPPGAVAGGLARNRETVMGARANLGPREEVSR